MNESNRTSTGFCLTRDQIGDYDSTISPFALLTIPLVGLDICALFVLIICVWKETMEKRAYNVAKGKQVKLLLTPEYMDRLRPPKRAPSAPLPTEDELQSNKVSKNKPPKLTEEQKEDAKKDEKVQTAAELSQHNSLLPSMTAKESSEHNVKGPEKKTEDRKEEEKKGDIKKN